MSVSFTISFESDICSKDFAIVDNSTIFLLFHFSKSNKTNKVIGIIFRRLINLKKNKKKCTKKWHIPQNLN